MLFLTIPAMVALMALNLPIISVLFQRGAFDTRAAVYTSQALLCYALGLWAFATIRVFVSSFYSLQDSKWPLKAAIVTLIVNVLAALALMHPLKHSGIALAGSIAASVNVLVLAFVLKRKIGTYLDRSFFVSIFKIIISALVMLAAIFLFDLLNPWNTYAAFKIRLLYLTTSIIIGAFIFFICAFFMKSPEMHAVVNMVKRKLTSS
jgi:putative peptidoglycan lipid II flippase